MLAGLKHFDPMMVPPIKRAISSALRVILKKPIQSDVNAVNSDHGSACYTPKETPPEKPSLQRGKS